MSFLFPLRSPCLSPLTPGLGLDVEELAEDCSAVRSQLEFLQRLLLQVRGEEDEQKELCDMCVVPLFLMSFYVFVRFRQSFNRDCTSRLKLGGFSFMTNIQVKTLTP